MTGYYAFMLLRHNLSVSSSSLAAWFQQSFFFSLLNGWKFCFQLPRLFFVGQFQCFPQVCWSSDFPGGQTDAPEIPPAVLSIPARIPQRSTLSLSSLFEFNIHFHFHPPSFVESYRSWLLISNLSITLLRPKENIDG